jgi:CheY-like chemotaxis protein
MTLRCLIVEDEIMIRDLIADIAAVEGWTVRSCGTIDDLATRLSPLPDLIFLDISLRQSDGVEALDMLQRHGFAGMIHIVSGHSLATIHQVRAIGQARGLTMGEPVMKPFHASEIVTTLRKRAAQRGNLLPAPSAGQSPRHDVRWQAWTDPVSGRTSWHDGRLAAGPAASSLWNWDALLAEQPVANPPAGRWTLAIPLSLDDARLFIGRHGPCDAPLTFVFSEDDVFADIERSRALLASLGARNIRVRIDHCGTRTFAMAGHRPLRVDEMVVRDFLRGQWGESAHARRIGMVADLAHRSGARLMAADVASGTPLSQLAALGFDLIQMAARSPAADIPRPSVATGDLWQRVSLAKLSSLRRFA